MNKRFEQASGRGIRNYLRLGTTCRRQAGCLLLPMLLAGLLAGLDTVGAENPKKVSLAEAGAVGDGVTLNTVVIQQAIDRVAQAGGGTIVVPPGRFLTGAIFLKPGVHLSLESGAVLLGSTNIADYPPGPTRIEGHTQIWRPALVNADKCDHLRITGSGTIQGGGKPFWEAFWQRLKADKKTRNLDVDRPRNLFIRDSKDVLIQGVSFRESGFWNVHLYRCQDVTVEQVDIRTPLRAPSTDGIDVDSCQRVWIRDCYISVDDDNIALKGTKGPFADRDADSPAVEHVRVSNCTFGLGYGAVTLGSEASRVRDVVVENCRMEGPEKNCLARFKLRPDTPQHYSDIHFRNITINSKGRLVGCEPWLQYFDLKGQPAPAQVVSNVTFQNITGWTTSLGRISGPTNSTLSDIVMEDVSLKLADTNYVIKGVAGLKLVNVRLNGALIREP